MNPEKATVELHSRKEDGVLWLTIDRQERRNAMSPNVIAGLTEAIEGARTDRELRAIVVSGAGDKAFCAGADLQTGKSFKFDYSEPQHTFANLLRAAKAARVPLIARVNGACMAGGMGLLAMCDLAIAVPHARFGLPETKIGVFPAQVLSVLQGLIGRRVLTQMCITGESVDAPTALAYGLVNEVSTDLDGAVQALLARILDKSPAAVRRGLYVMKHVEHMTFEQSVAFTEGQISLFALTEDAAEGQLAFRERRQPQWSGR